MSEVNDSNSSAPESANDSTFDPASDGSEGQEQAAPVVPQKNLKKFKYKADGQEFEEEIDLNDEDTIKRHLSMSKAANKRMQESSQIKRQNEQLIKMLQEDPLSILTNEQFGGSKKFRELAENYLAKELEAQLLSPEEKRQREMEERLRKYEQDERSAKEKHEAEQIAKLEQHYASEFEQKIITGLQSQGLPKTAKTAKRMAELMAKNLEHGYDMSPEQLATIVKEDYLRDMKEMFGASDGDVLLKLLGEDVANKIRKSDLARLRGGGITPNNPGKPVQSDSKNQDAPKRMRGPEYEEWLNKRNRR